jgi:imidazolonepropionase-like amidohydrolase
LAASGHFLSKAYFIIFVDLLILGATGCLNTVATPISECDACGAELTNAEQSRANVEAMKKIELKAKLHASKQSGSDPNL